MNLSNMSERGYSNSKTIFTEAVGQEISKLRRERSMSGRELADLIDLSQQQVSRYECGVCNLTIDTLIIILNALDVSLSNFFNQVFLRILEKEKMLCVQYHNVFASANESKEVKKQLEAVDRYNQSNLWG
ncbi:helix-turn-helix domain-containing protein [Providencia rustigianii]|uniref:helix-turn-helix domain-containing protein n=1 Tax=Providencia rustigianii TaxID=158850 RepID=UPI000F7128DA|nr:helix-turn-helix transcriptional regulator [Providencia rustigianii]MTC61458.1 helix-turn-helix domain-containing protein [Providencia rustigianii]VEH56760.1 anaerobic benzoate catabolism transcriptional regulator [Providencia rustigianii]